MRTFLALLGLFALTLTISANAQDTSQEQNVRNLANEIAANSGANKHIVFDQFMTRIKGVEKAVGKPLEYRLALQLAKCADLAAHPDDPDKFGTGIAFSNMKVEDAIPTCELAYKHGGDKIGLAIASLSRAFNKAQKYDISFELAKQAVAVGYPYADVLVAQHYFYGDGMDKNNVEQFRWFKMAAEKGVSAGMRATANNYTEGHGTEVNFDQAYYWSLQAIKETDGRAFYQLGQVLEGKAVGNSKAQKLLALAKQAYEVAAGNGVTVAKDIKNVNKQIYPNKFSSHAKEFKLPSGRKINGKFVPEDNDMNWSSPKENLSDINGNFFNFARTKHDGNFLSVWYQHSLDRRESGWYVSFSHIGLLEDINSILVSSVISGKTENIELNLSDTQVDHNLFNVSTTGRINFRDVLLLSRGELVKIRYKKSAKQTNSTYTFALNDAEIYTGNEITQTANIVISQLIETARKLDKNCCEAPKIDPLSKRYGELFKLCREKTTDYLIENKGIRQNCHMIFKYAKGNYRTITAPLESNLERLLNEVENVMKKT